MDFRSFFNHSLALRIFLFFTFLNTSLAQSNVTEPIDSTNYHEFYHYLQSGDFYCASGFYQKALKNIPCNRALIINGIKMYIGMIDLISSESLKEQYADTVMSLYDQRQSCFPGDSTVILNRKLYTLFFIYHNIPVKYTWLYSLFKDAFSLSPECFESYNIIPYFDIARRSILSGRRCLSDDELEDLYFTLDKILEKRMKEDPNDIRLSTIRDQLNAMITIEPELNCEFIIDNLLPRFEKEKDNEKLAYSILALILNCRTCSDQEIAEIMHTLEFYKYTKQAEMLKSIWEKR